MKNSRNENLFNYLSEMDDELLERALSVDDAEKLQDYVKKQNTRKKHSLFPLKPQYTKILAACLALVLGTSLIFPMIFPSFKEQEHLSWPDRNLNGQAGKTDHESALPPWLREDEAGFHIESIDMLNYYSAMKLLSDAENTAADISKDHLNFPVFSAASNISVLDISMPFTATSEHYSDNINIDYDIPNYNVDTEKSGIGYDTPPDDFQAESTKPEKQLVYYYELDPNEVFTIYQVIYFQTELTDKDGFLASKIGIGIVDVVITDNSLEPMITFKNGDKYYSCCLNSASPDSETYSTHKYIEGFYLVKNMEQDNYSFTITYETSFFGNKTKKALRLTCDSYKNGGPNADGELPVISDTYISSVSGDFTIADLENYFSTGHTPNDTENEIPSAELVATYSNGLYQFETYSDGTFVYRSTMENDLAYRKGTYQMLCDQIIFTFITNSDKIESIECDLLGPNEGDGFYFQGVLYELLY